MRSFPHKDPDSTLKYWFDWAPWLTVEAGGDIESYEVAIDSGDGSLTLGDHAIDGSLVMLWLSGGTEGQTYVVRCRVVLTDGTVEDASRELHITPH